jgi:cell division protein FtsX
MEKEEAKKEEIHEAKAEEKKDLEKPLEKMTATELRQIALGIQGLEGVHAMKKEDLLKAIKEARGIKDEELVKTKAAGVHELKKMIVSLKKEKEGARTAKNRAKVDVIRRRINRLKKRTRKLASS